MVWFVIIVALGFGRAYFLILFAVCWCSGLVVADLAGRL